MQDRYTGDVGDFGKYGLLRAIASPSTSDTGGPLLNLGIVWYRYPNESHNADGKHISYLEKHKRRMYHKCDPELYDCLFRIVKNSKSRKILEIENSKILGSDTRFFSEYCPGGSREPRTKWHNRALARMKGCDLVFLDPDNGLRGKFQNFTSGKHAYFCEAHAFILQGSALIIYHHLNRSTLHDKQIKERVTWLARYFCDRHLVAAFRYRRGTSRAFFVIWPTDMNEVLLPRIRAFSEGPWVAEGHFDPVIHPGI